MISSPNCGRIVSKGVVAVKTIFETKTKIVGVTKGKRQTYLANLSEFDEIDLIREEDNPYDPNAISVVNSDGNKLGYLNSKLAEDLCYFSDSNPNAFLVGSILEITGGSEGKNYGCNIEVSLIDPEIPNRPIKNKKSNAIGNVCLILTLPFLVMLFSGKILFILLGVIGLCLFGTVGAIFKLNL